MGKMAQLAAPSLGWARGQFERYYAAHPVDPPDRFARREFAAFPFAAETQMRRHASFRTVEEFRGFLTRESPRHVYYSSAYYQRPDHPQMAGKSWLGADLIFDLDADHLRGAERLTYPEQLARVKERLLSLLDEFLWGDFGIDPEQTRLVFSGGRGYHVHIRDERFLGLTSPERRELVEYIMMVGFDPTSVIEVRREDPANPLTVVVDGGTEGGGRRTRPRSYRRLPPPEAPGWRGRTTRAVVALLERWDAAGAEAAAGEMAAAGVAPEEARRLARLLVDRGSGERIRTSLSLDVFKGQVPKELIPALFAQAAVEVQGETDAPVTTDIHRLIRLPGSLHGGSGLRVLPLTREELERFDPLIHAVVEYPAGDRTTVELVEPVDATLGGASFQGASGDRNEVPTALALFLVLRGEAVIPA